ncbi:MAG: insulinase family protein [Planctomycetota bacterium]
MSPQALARAGVATPLAPLPHPRAGERVRGPARRPALRSPGDAGLTHALEHLLFRGAGPYPSAGALLARFAELGRSPRPSDDALVITWDLEPAALEPGLELLGELLLRPRYHGFAAEVEVIREELLEGLDERGRPTAPEDLLRGIVFAGHPLARPILGDEAGLRRLTPERVDAWRQRLVQRENVVVAAAGPVGQDAWTAATACLDQLPAGARLPEPAPPPELPPALRFVDTGSGPQVELWLALRGPGRAAPEFAAFEVVHALLDGGPAAALTTELVDSGLSYDAQASLSAFPECSLLELNLSVARPKLNAALEATAALLGQLWTRVTPEALAALQATDARRLRWAADDPTAAAEDLALAALRGEPLDPAAALARRAAAGLEAVQAQARALAEPARRHGLVLGEVSATHRRRARRLFDQTW